MKHTEIEFVGATIVSVGYCYGQLCEMHIEQPDGKVERISFGIQAMRFEEMKVDHKSKGGW